MRGVAMATDHSALALFVESEPTVCSLTMLRVVTFDYLTPSAR